MNGGMNDDRDQYLYGDDERSPEPSGNLGKRNNLTSARVISVMLVVIALILLCVMIALVSSRYVIKNTLINGESPYSEEEIRSVLEEYFEERGSTSYFYIDVDELSEKIKSKMPYVKSIEIEKKAPDTLIFTLTGESAEAYIEYMGKYYLLNADMKVLGSLANEPARESLIELYIDLPSEIVIGSTIAFSDESRMDAESYTRIYKALEDAGLREMCKSLDAMNKFDLSMKLSSGVDVKIGSIKDIEEKLTTLSKWISDNEDLLEPTLNLDISILKKISMSYD